MRTPTPSEHKTVQTRILLHQLMTAQIRVNYLSLPKRDVMQ